MALSRKEAVDATTKEYWKAYFGPYGKAFTEDVPRRVAHFIAKALVAPTANKTAKTITRILKASITPIGWAKSPTGSLIFEGVFKGVGIRDAKKTDVYQGFRAEFDPTGGLVSCKHIAAN